MNKIFCLLIIAIFALAKEPTWNFDRNITLQKDEPYRGIVFQDNLKKPLYLRWTLYKNYGLVVYVNYDKFPYQFILYKDYQKDTFKLELFGGEFFKQASYLYISFKDFDQKSNKASLWLGISGQAQFLPQED